MSTLNFRRISEEQSEVWHEGLKPTQYRPKPFASCPTALWPRGRQALLRDIPDVGGTTTLEQSSEYRESVLPSAIRKRVTVEAASTFGWERFAGLDGHKIGIDQFGASASADEIMERFGFTVEHVTAAALRQLGREEEASRETDSPGEGETTVAPTSSTEGHS